MRYRDEEEMGFFFSTQVDNSCDLPCVGKAKESKSAEGKANQ